MIKKKKEKNLTDSLLKNKMKLRHLKKISGC